MGMLRRSRGGGRTAADCEGANLAMEKVEAAAHGWEQVSHGCKNEVDANFKRMLHYACEKNEHMRSGWVGSHNSDVSYALLLREREDVRRVELRC